METEEKVSKNLQWHPAFYAGIQIELEEYRDILTFEDEHQLSTKPLEADIVVIKKEPGVQIKKNIGQIFREHNIIEYKAPGDSFSIDDYYKVYGYACIYKTAMKNVNEIKADEITLTIAVNVFPREMLKEIQLTRNLTVVKFDEGIYHISGEIFPVQILHTPKLSEESNFWLRNLTNKLKTQKAVRKLLDKYNERKQEPLHQSIMDVIVKANRELFEEVGDMCDALMEIVKPKVDAKIKEACEEARKEALEEGRMGEKKDLISKKLAKGMSVEEIAEWMEEPVEVILKLMKFM